MSGQIMKSIYYALSIFHVLQIVGSFNSYYDDDYEYSSSLFNLTDLSNPVGPSSEARVGGCSFPERWHGTWFQSGVRRNIKISKHRINVKGHCLVSKSNKYLVYNERRECYRCLVFHEKHINVVQYKETFCLSERGSLESICSTITGDANLYTMFRLNAKPIKCPYRSSYTFSYNGGHGKCQHPISHINSCTNSSRIAFNYQACPDIIGSQSSVEEVECLASWKEGSSRYMVGLIQYQHHASYEDRFRCFVYEKPSKGARMMTTTGRMEEHGGDTGDSNSQRFLASQMRIRNPYYPVHQMETEYGRPFGEWMNDEGELSMENGDDMSETHDSLEKRVVLKVAQSGDATCNGLAVMEGARILYLRQERKRQCKFPLVSQIMGKTEWTTLDEKSLLVMDSLRGSVSITRLDEQPDEGSMTSHHHGHNDVHRKEDHMGLEQVATSSSSLSSKKSGGKKSKGFLSSLPMMKATCYEHHVDHQTFVLHATYGCQSGYQCLALYPRSSSVLEIQLGLVARRAEEACDGFNFNRSHLPYVTLVGRDLREKECPSWGRFVSTGVGMTTAEGDGYLRESTSAPCGFYNKISKMVLNVGCQEGEVDKIKVKYKCSDERNDKSSVAELKDEDYSCHDSWEENGSWYTIMRQGKGRKGRLYCFQFIPPMLAEDWNNFGNPGIKDKSWNSYSSLAGKINMDDNADDYERSERSSLGLSSVEEKKSDKWESYGSKGYNNNDDFFLANFTVIRHADSCRRNPIAVSDRGLSPENKDHRHLNNLPYHSLFLSSPSLYFNLTRLGNCVQMSGSWREKDPGGMKLMALVFINILWRLNCN